MEKKQEEQARQMKELQGHAEKKAAILEKRYEIEVELCIQLLAIKGKSLLFLTTSIPQHMMNCPQVVPYP